MRNIPVKEDLITEFKSDKKGYSDTLLVEEIVGMTNTKGGTLYLGVEDNGEITGVSKKHVDAIGVTALIANNTVPPVSVRASIIKEEDKEVLKIEIPISRTVVSTSSGKMLRRRLKSDNTPEVIPMYSYEISTRLSELSLLDFSASPLSCATIEDFDPRLRDKLRTIIQSKPDGDKSLMELSDEELDKALRLTTEIEGVLHPTVTGMLILGKESRIAELMPTVKSSFQVLEGTNIRLNITTTASLLEVLEKFETYEEAWNPEQEIDYGFHRIAVPEFDKSAFREGLMNAFCHRDYTMLGTVRVLIDDEGMTISNPGGFIDGVTLDNLLSVEPHGKNPTLVDVLKRIGLTEKTGRGIDRIYEGSIIYGRPWPDYSESTSNNVKLFIQRSKADENFTRFIIEEQEKTKRHLSIYSLMILSLLNEENMITIDKIAKNTHLPQSKLKGAIENLIDDKLIACTIKNNTKHYYLLKDENDYLRKSNNEYDFLVINKNDYQNMIIELAKKQDGFITKKDVANLLNLTLDQSYKEIKKLSDNNKLYIYQKGKYTKYKLK